MSDSTREPSDNSTDYDAIVVGASLAGCTTAMLLARGGARVALVEKQPDPDAYKRMCSHFIQASGVPTLERLGLLEPILAAGGVRSRVRAWTRWGVIVAPPEQAGSAVNLRREILDPMVRAAAAETPGVELLLGRSAQRLSRAGESFAGVAVRDRDGEETELRARLVVGADGRDSKVAELAGVEEKILPHNRFAYGGYFEGKMPEGAPDGTIWMADPQFGAAFPTDGGEVFYVAMPTKDRLPEFKRDPEAALVSFVGDLPDAPPIRSSRLVGDVLGKIEMPNRVRVVTAPGLALVGDAALATDPLFGVGCGWAFQSGEWLADAVAPALAGSEPLADGLKRYRRRHRRQLRGHAFFIHDYATGRRLSPPERFLFSAAARDEKVAVTFDHYATRQIGPARMFAGTVPRALLVNTRHALQGRSDRAATGGGERLQTPAA
jgi:2-polyprenyl-6-methoxyphenol hydroxylase-like FAD-dependent oxidoreductase